MVAGRRGGMKQGNGFVANILIQAHNPAANRWVKPHVGRVLKRDKVVDPWLEVPAIIHYSARVADYRRLTVPNIPPADKGKC